MPKPSAPLCEGTEHALGTHGHDDGPARFTIKTVCPCGFTDTRRLCAGRVRDMSDSPRGIKCAGCGTNFEHYSAIAQITPLPNLKRAEDAAREHAPTQLAPLPTGAVFSDFAIQQRSRGYSELTIKNRAYILGAFERSAQSPLLSIGVQGIQAYLGRPGVKSSTRRTELMAIRAFYRFAVKAGHLATDPTVDLDPVSVPRGKPRPFARQQIVDMLATGAYARTRAMIILGYYQGFRVSSIARVHGEDVDLASGTIRTVVKGGKERTAPLHPVVASLARTMPSDDWWFPARKGREGHIHPSSVSDRVAAARDRAGIRDKKLSAHSLRHSFATHMVDDGVDIRVIQELMMHESLSSTQIYAGVSERKQREGIERLTSQPVPKRSGRGGTAAGSIEALISDRDEDTAHRPMLLPEAIAVDMTIDEMERPEVRERMAPEVRGGPGTTPSEKWGQ